MRYLVLTKADADAIVEQLDKAGALPANVARIVARLRLDTGADMEEVVASLKGAETCAACRIEAQEASCVAISTRAAGRRLARLLQRARGERAPGATR